VAYGTY